MGITRVVCNTGNKAQKIVEQNVKGLYIMTINVTLTEDRMLTIANDAVATFEESARGRIYRDANRVNWQVGHAGKHTMRVDRIHPDLMAGLDCNEYCNEDEPLISTMYRITLDSTARVNEADQRITRSLYAVGFTPEDSDGNRRPYLLTNGGRLQVQSAGGERLSQLEDAVGLIRHAFTVAEINDESTFWNTPIKSSSVVFNPVMLDPVSF